MKVKTKRTLNGWVALINPYNDAWHQFGSGATRRAAIVSALIAWHQFNRNTGSNQS